MDTTKHEHKSSKPLFTAGAIWSAVVILSMMIVAIVVAVVIVSKNRHANIYSGIETKLYETQQNKLNEAAERRFASRTRDLAGNYAEGKITLQQMTDELTAAKKEYDQGKININSPGLDPAPSRVIMISAPTPPATAPTAVQVIPARVETPLPPPLPTTDCSTQVACVQQIGLNEWKVTVDPRILEFDTGITINAGETIEFNPNPSSQVLSPPEKPFGPAGDRLAKFATVSPQDFRAKDAGCIGLIGKFGSGWWFGIPQSQQTTATTTGTLILSANIRTPYIQEASGNFEVIVRKK